MESADERALHRELQELAKKREVLEKSKRRGSGSAAGGVGGRRSVFARLGDEVSRAGGARQTQLKENWAKGNASRRLGKRDSDRFDADSAQDGAIKRQRLHSAVARPEGGQGRTEQRRTSSTAVTTSADNEHAQQRKQRAVAPYAQKEGIARSRRMFGALMGHLGKAKERIQKDTDLFKRQDSKQQEAEQREKLQSQNLETRARREAEVTRLEALLERTELDRSEQIARAKLDHLQMVRKSQHQAKFLVTVASPPIYYLPVRHTKDTEDLLAASMEACEAKMKASSRTHDEKLRKLETEFAVKLEQLREELEVARKDEEEKVEEKPNDKEDAMEVEEDAVSPRKEAANEDMAALSALPAVSAMEVEETVQESVLGSDLGDSPVEKAHDKTDGPNDDDGEVRSDSRSGDGGGRKLAAAADREEPRVNESEVGSASSRGDIEESQSAAQANKEQAPERTNQENVAAEEDYGKPEKAVVEMVTPAGADKAKMASTVNVDAMKVAELRKELKKRGLDTKGLKTVLVQRLKAAIHEENESQ
ncbi:hypothetical protein BBO99_00008570 [Phytophthora kernoviae]|uniref:SAP domain-containing protein n=2 Tax=Phytophthora kernoviae TaxID=325452 RepID=A0A3R7GRP9_9STRA|nr:hypothetical protein G195_011027 [Phytophthora kernoviae 00238/432]KAG2510981.1 hypothetical protein JM16_008317 [Phytophthora kernoviae]KAG2514572.1 hypothetical protein JM18_008218 [Phytophthora kernoviae]RLN06529.1 hypothetical protein BBI17_008570 [Phytophthora kernoviae]RLN75056.1 hypothetical protein BBO99_00008570 [Phytophthora kernoviae]